MADPTADDIFGEQGDVAALDRARTAWTLGLLAGGLCLAAPCSSYMTLFIALPMGGFATWYARGALAGSPDELTVAYGRTGLITGVVSLIYSMLFLTVLAAVILMYGAMFAAIILGS